MVVYSTLAQRGGRRVRASGVFACTYDTRMIDILCFIWSCLVTCLLCCVTDLDDWLVSCLGVFWFLKIVLAIYDRFFRVRIPKLVRLERLLLSRDISACDVGWRGYEVPLGLEKRAVDDAAIPVVYSPAVQPGEL